MKIISRIFFFFFLILDTLEKNTIHSREFAQNARNERSTIKLALEKKKKKKRGKYYRVQFDERVENRIETGISGILSPQFTSRMGEWNGEKSSQCYPAQSDYTSSHAVGETISRRGIPYLALIVGSRSLANTCAHSVKIPRMHGACIWKFRRCATRYVAFFSTNLLLEKKVKEV